VAAVAAFVVSAHICRIRSPHRVTAVAASEPERAFMTIRRNMRRKETTMHPETHLQLYRMAHEARARMQQRRPEQHRDERSERPVVRRTRWRVRRRRAATL
jgi:hypothetical protein